MTTPSDPTKAPSRATAHRHRRNRRGRAAAMTLTGLLGAAWAALIVSRYSGLLPN